MPRTKNGIFLSSVEHSFGYNFTTDAQGVVHYTGTMYTVTVDKQLDNDNNDSIFITARGRSSMISTYNTYNIADQYSFYTPNLAIAGLVGWASNPNALPNIRGTTTVVTSGNNNLVTYTPSFPVSALSNYQLNRPGFTNLVRLVAASDYQTSSLATVLAIQSVVVPNTIPSGATSVSASAVTFPISEVSDFSKTVKIQVASSFVVSGVTITTKWIDASAVPSFGLWSIPDALSISVVDSEQNGVSALQISSDAPVGRQLRGLMWRDLVISIRATGTATWLPYSPEPNTYTGIVYKTTLPDSSAFVQGGQYDIRMQVRGSVSASSTLIPGLLSTTVSAYVTPNAFKTVNIAVSNEAGQTTVTAPTVAWVPASGAIAGYSELINFVEDELSVYYIDPAVRANIQIIWAMSFAGGLYVDMATGSKVFSSLANGSKYSVKLQGRFSYTAGGRTVTEYSRIIAKEAAPAGAPAISNASVSYTYNTLISGVSGTGSAATYALASAAAGLVAGSIQSVFSATLADRGSPLSTYTVVYVPQEYSSAITQSDIVKSNVALSPAPDNFVNNVLTLRPAFVAKACILYVINGNGSAVQIIPVGGLNSV